jgi:hypothetical protein
MRVNPSRGWYVVCKKFFRGGPLLSVPAPLPSAVRSLLAWVRSIAGLSIIAFLLWQLGTGPFLGGLRLIDGWGLTVAVGIGLLTTAVVVAGEVGAVLLARALPQRGPSRRIRTTAGFGAV